MSPTANYRLVGEALPKDGIRMLDEICEHFIEHARVERFGNVATLTNELGVAEIRLDEGRMRIELGCPTSTALDLSRNVLAEHLFYFAGDEPFDLSWRELPASGPLPNLHEVTVVSAHDITPHMRRVTFRCADVAPFLGGGMHVRLLVPPKNREPLWPGYRADGRIGWPEGEDELLVRVYTIRAVDAERGELHVDFLQHPADGVATPGADFARDAKAGDRAAMLGPGGGNLPEATSIYLVGDESALPAIARIAEEVPAGTRLRAVIEVEDESEEQPLRSLGDIEVRWLHRRDNPNGERPGILSETVSKAIAKLPADTFIWVACEREDVRVVRDLLKRRKHDRKKQYVAWYWEKTKG